MMKRPVRWFLATVLVVGAFAAKAAETEEAGAVFVIETSRPLSAAEQTAMAKRLGLEYVERLSPHRSEYFDRIYRAKGPRQQEALLVTAPLVKKVFISQRLELQSVENAADPLLSYQWHLSNKGYVLQDELTDSRSVSRPGVADVDIGWAKARKELEKRMARDARVAVIDSGLDYEHDEIVEQLYKNEAECNNGRIPLGAPKEDKDGNGYKGDCLGINLVPQGPEFANKPMDDIGHGTHVAGIIAATPDNGKGIAGVSGRIKVLPIKVTAKKKAKDEAPFTDRVAEAILYAADRDVDVINLSLGWPLSQNTEYVHKAILEAQAKGVLIVAAAGNNSHSGPIYPCAYKKVICVGSVTVDGTLSAFSNYGPQVDIVAPGTQILSLFPKTMISNFFPAKGYEIKSGTSQAAPLVSGVAALLKVAFPTESSERIRGRLLAAARPLPNLRTGGGLLRMDDSLLGKTHRTRAVEYKEIELALVKNGTVEMTLAVENFVTAVAPARVKVLKTGPQAELQGIQLVGDQLEITGRVTDFSRHYEWPISFSVDGHVNDIFLPLVRAEAEEKTTRQLPEGLDPLTLRTIYDLDGKSERPEYFRVSRAEDGIKLEVYELGAQRLSPLFERILKGETHFLGSATMDFNADGARDFLFFTYHMEGAMLRMSLHYFDRLGRGLYSDNGQVTMTGNNSFNIIGLTNFKKVNFVTFTLPDGKIIRLPTVIEQGIRAEADLSKEEKRRSPFLRDHLYYLEPIYVDGNLVLRSRTVDSDALEKEIQAKLNLYYYDKLHPRVPVMQTSDQRATGDAQFLLDIGQDEAAKAILVTLRPNGEIEWRQIHPGFNLNNYGAIPLWSVGAKSNPLAGTGIYGFVFTYAFEGAVWNADAERFDNSFQVILPDTTEKLARLLQIYETSDALYVVFESTSLLNSVRVDRSGRATLTSALVHRTSFFDQYFSQIVSPIGISTRGGFSPGLYVDNSQINARSILSWDVAGEELKAPVALTLHAPPGCKALNPVMLAGHYHYVLTCKDSDQLTFVPVKK